VDPGQRKQEILGFGAALTDASCYLFYKLNSQEREALVSELFGPAGPRFSVVRTCIGASDYSTEGVRINAVTVQNEVDTDQDGRMPAALWGQEYEIEFVKNYLGPAFERASLDAKIWILDQNWRYLRCAAEGFRTGQPASIIRHVGNQVKNGLWRAFDSRREPRVRG